MDDNIISATAETQYNDWQGTVAGDNSDHRRVSELLSVDDTGLIVRINISIYGGTQYIKAWALQASWIELENQARAGRVEATLVVDRTEHPADHAGANLPAPPNVPLTRATDLLTFGPFCTPRTAPRYGRRDKGSGSEMDLRRRTTTSP